MDHTVRVPKTLSCRASVAHRVSAQPPWLRVVSIFLLQEKNCPGYCYTDTRALFRGKLLAESSPLRPATAFVG